jgi:aryl-alcohol dehydrogenase-like predicted oxidoreductase
MDYKTLMGYGKKKNKESKPKENKVLESIKDEFNINEGPAYEYKKHSKKIEKSLKDLQKNYLDFYEVLRKKGLNDEASDFLDNYKKNVVGFTKKYKKDFGKLM